MIRLVSPFGSRYTRFMMADGYVEGDDSPLQEEPEPWRPPARCPECHGSQTRFITLNYEMSVYECEVCGVQFEVEQ